MEETDLSPFSFTSTTYESVCLSNRETKDALLQWNLDAALQVLRFRFSGPFPNNGSDSDYERIIKDFFRSDKVLTALGVVGSIVGSFTLDMEQLALTVTDMVFFDRLENTIAPHGHIRGCFDETFDGITVGDELREMLLNEESANSNIFNADEKKEYIFHIFRTLVIGGPLNQVDSKIDRYLSITKDFYKESATIYRDAKTKDVRLSGRVYLVKSIPGLEIFPFVNPHNSLALVIDPLKKQIIALRMTFKPFW